MLKKAFGFSGEPYHEIMWHNERRRQLEEVISKMTAVIAGAAQMAKEAFDQKKINAGDYQKSAVSMQNADGAITKIQTAQMEIKKSQKQCLSGILNEENVLTKIVFAELFVQAQASHKLNQVRHLGELHRLAMHMHAYTKLSPVKPMPSYENSEEMFDAVKKGDLAGFKVLCAQYALFYPDGSSLLDYNGQLTLEQAVANTRDKGMIAAYIAAAKSEKTFDELLKNREKVRQEVRAHLKTENAAYLAQVRKSYEVPRAEYIAVLGCVTNDETSIAKYYGGKTHQLLNLRHLYRHVAKSGCMR
jgi:hypothetical protein